MTKSRKTETFEADRDGVAKAATILRDGGLIAFPTETVYGLGALATNDRAVASIFSAKNRPSFNPLIVHVADMAAAENIAVFDATARRLAEAFWPGALTLVLPLRPDAGLSRLVTAGGDLVAIRVPDHPLAAKLLRAVDGPVAAPSANPSGRISPTSPQHVLVGLGGRIDGVMNGGACTVGVESTIIGLHPVPTLLRAGGLPVEVIETCLGTKLASATETDQPVAPGQLASHYAPAAHVRLNADTARNGEVLLGFGPVEADLNLSRNGDLIEAAAHLFEYLHRLDKTGQPIAVSPVPEHGLGLAINDRLRRAAAPKPR